MNGFRNGEDEAKAAHVISTLARAAQLLREFRRDPVIARARLRLVGAAPTAALPLAQDMTAAADTIEQVAACLRNDFVRRAGDPDYVRPVGDPHDGIPI